MKASIRNAAGTRETCLESKFYSSWIFFPYCNNLASRYLTSFEVVVGDQGLPRANAGSVLGTYACNRSDYHTRLYAFDLERNMLPRKHRKRTMVEE